MKFGSKGQIPYIELNGEQIPDSNIIINVLKEKFNVDPDKGVSEGDLAVGHAATMMLEHHTAHVGFHYRYGHHMQVTNTHTHKHLLFPAEILSPSLVCTNIVFPFLAPTPHNII